MFVCLFVIRIKIIKFQDPSMYSSQAQIFVESLVKRIALLDYHSAELVLRGYHGSIHP